MRQNLFPAFARQDRRVGGDFQPDQSQNDQSQNPDAHAFVDVIEGELVGRVGQACHVNAQCNHANDQYGGQPMVGAGNQSEFAVGVVKSHLCILLFVFSTL